MAHAKSMTQTTISVSGTVGHHVRALVDEYPGTNINRVGRALIRLGLQAAAQHPAALVEELRQIDAPWSPNSEVYRAR